jgi:RNA polymerase sigma factor (sigma-70 family)
MDDDDLAGLVARVKSGNEAAVRELLLRFEDEVRMMVRVRLPRSLRSQFDSMDFVQAVWKSFFSGFGEEPDRFANLQHLRGFLAGVARNKVLEEHRRLTCTRKYNLAREEPLYIRRGDREVLRDLPSSDPSPSQDIQAKERWAQLVAGRTPQEVKVVELRRSGLTYPEIAAQTGLHESAVRRVIDSIRQRLEARTWR